MEIPFAAFITNRQSVTIALALPVEKMPSRLHSVNVQFAIVGSVFSIQRPVPRVSELVTLTPRSCDRLSGRRVTFCIPKLGLLCLPLPVI